MSRPAAPEAPATEAPAAAAAATACPLCGARFERGVQTCGSCPLHGACDVVCCPNCGYSYPRTSHLVEWWRRWRGHGA